MTPSFACVLRAAAPLKKTMTIVDSEMNASLNTSKKSMDVHSLHDTMGSEKRNTEQGGGDDIPVGMHATHWLIPNVHVVVSVAISMLHRSVSPNATGCLMADPWLT